MAKKTVALKEPVELKNKDLIAIRKKVYAKTLETEKKKPEKKEKDPDAEFKEKLNSVFEKADFGCQAAHVKRVVEILASEIKGHPIEVEIPKKTSDKVNRSLLAVVPLTNTNSHSYPLNKPCIVLPGSSSIAVRADGTTGNNLPTPESGNAAGSMRNATKEEIDWFFAVVEVLGVEDEVIGKFFAK